jgi:hypothetical protein
MVRNSTKFQERELILAASQNQKILVADLDGVILDSHYTWLGFIKRKTSKLFEDRFSARIVLGNTRYEELKDEFRRTAKRDIPQMHGAAAFLDRARERGYFIVLLSARPYHRYLNLYGDTRASLHGLDYDILMFDMNKQKRLVPFLKNIKVVVEDDLDQAISFINPWTHVYLKVNRENKGATVQDVRPVHNLSAITL